MTAPGGGVTPLSIEGTDKTFGSDIIASAGGAAQGRPTGASAGARAVMTASDGATRGKRLEEIAAGSP